MHFRCRIEHSCSQWSCLLVRLAGASTFLQGTLLARYLTIACDVKNTESNDCHQTGSGVKCSVVPRPRLIIRLPKRLIWRSDNPWAAAHEAAPMRKLCDLYRVLSRPQKAKDLFNSSTNCERVTGEPSEKQKSAPCLVPLTLRKSAIIVTGHIGSDLFSKTVAGWAASPCL